MPQPYNRNSDRWDDDQRGSAVRRWTFFAVLVTGLSVAGCDQLGFHSWRWHQKLTVVVETPEGLRSGSSVSEARVHRNPTWWGMGDARGAGSTSFRGEAVAVDLGNGQYVFVLLRRYGFETAWKAFVPEPKLPRNREQSHQMYDRLESLHETRTLPIDLYPFFSTFGDIRDPASFKRVNPIDLSSTFGSGFRLRSVTLTMTDEPVTENRIELILPWLEELGRRQPNLIGKPAHGWVSEQPDPEVYQINPSDFSTEFYR